jgi:hypothetical protein
MRLHSLRVCAACLVLSITALAAEADPAPQIWLNPGFLSYHFDRSADYKEDNFGIGAEAVLGLDHGFFIGTFINSQESRSDYIMYQWRPLHWKVSEVAVSLGLAAGFADGYPTYHEGGWRFGILPALFVEGERFGANFVIVPSSDWDNWLAAVQFKLRVW